jgi:hypothetical protein
LLTAKIVPSASAIACIEIYRDGKLIRAYDVMEIDDRRTEDDENTLDK